MSTEMLTLKALSPLALHRHRASEQFSATLDYIPGSAVRGALADLYLAGEPKRAQEPEFQQLFISGNVLFSDFLPSSGGHSSLTRLSPATAVACKRFDEQHSGSLSDSLLWLELVRDRETELINYFNQWRTCSECGSAGLDGKRDRVELGYYTSVAGYERINVRRRMIMGVAISRSTKTAAHSMLFSHEAIEESDVHQDVLFRGTVTVPNPKTRLTLQQLLPRNQSLAVGYGRSRGWGRLEGSWDTPRAELTSLEERWENLNNAVRQLWKRFDMKPAGQYFSLTLQSHLALRDGAGQPVLGKIATADLDLPGPVERCRCVLSAVPIAGWNTALDLPKADTLALSRGSVLLFRLPLDTDRGLVIERLGEIEREGAGERRAEGFGAITVCDPFHYYFTLRELKGG